MPGNAAHEVLALQRRIGNRAVGTLLHARRQIDVPGDAHEREADRLADRALPVPAVAQAASPVGQPLAPALRRHFEARLGHDFGSVRLHASAEAASASAALQARAFTQQHDIYFGAGQFDPGSESGRQLLAHELAHVLQQSRDPALQGRVQRQTEWSLKPARSRPSRAPAPDEQYTYQDVYDLKERWEAAVIRVARALLPRGQERADFARLLIARRRTTELTPGTTSIRGGLGGGNVDASQLTHAHADEQQRLASVVANRYQFELVEMLHTRLVALAQQETQHTPDPVPSRSRIMGMVKDAYVESLNDATDWGIIDREIELADQSTVVNTMTPVNAYYDPKAFGDYEHSGWASMARNLPLDAGHGRTTNLWHSRLTTSDGTPIFEAFRSGSLGAKGVGSDDEQLAFSTDKAHGLLQAIAINLLRREHPDRKRSAAAGNLGNEQPLRVDVVSISLQTRSPGRIGTKHIGPFDERDDVQLQQQALMAWHDRQETFAGLEGLPPRDVKYNVIFFATGVNAAADFLGHKQDEINRGALDRLDHAYDDWWGRLSIVLLAEDDAGNVRELRAKMAMAAMLRQQIRESWKWSIGFKDYRLPALIANLAALMGHAVQYNCKSGKDRTSVMDVESKFMALRIHDWIAEVGADEIPERATRHAPALRSGEIHEVYGFRDAADKENYRRLLVEAGNLELQKLNTGSKGYKIIPKPAAERNVAARIGKVADLVLGLTRTVEVKTRYREEDFG